MANGYLETEKHIIQMRRIRSKQEKGKEKRKILRAGFISNLYCLLVKIKERKKQKAP